jgi:hypothetical protein
MSPMQLNDTTAQLRVELERAQIEIERLKRDLEIWRRNGGDDLMRAEIERLKALSQNNAHSWDAIVRERDELRAALAFARSVIKSGEPWTDECERRLALEGK